MRGALDKDCLSDAPSADTDVDSEAEESDLGEGARADEADEGADADVAEGRSSTDGEAEEVGPVPTGACWYCLHMARDVALHDQERQIQGHEGAHVRPMGRGIARWAAPLCRGL